MPSVVSHENFTKVVWYILVQLRSLNRSMSMVSGISVQVSAGKFRNCEFRNSGIEGILSF
jgi:hypothetical protein